MTDKKQAQLPLPSEPGFVGENGEYVTVLTPDNKALTSPTDFDPNGLRMNMWTVNLHDADMRTAYYWWVCCCPCIPLAQLETRLGLNSYGSGVFLDLIAYTSRLLLFLLTVVYLIKGYLLPFAISLLLFVLCLLGVAYRVSRARMLIRERLDISGSAKDDRTTGCLRGASAIRQMAVQLKCDQVHFGAPATLQAFQV
ncbi:hypothetical protein KXD40_008942 [Peronospora effusa]|uniref:PLAC8 family protein n=1 Tax=Peronospora effusa TaxID=542832 RepID=A0A3M6VJZ0_9STRA|nr:hypothetical protein DD238_007750 [Peronospora effusa]RQM11979.1 hypothetical protein DD237_008489 [Peronospora effusa]UIZ22052.1 hypothetical protein KXD40_008942 [Peronospora effusa]CAI5703781.1 unnamed protein product [Peronospora effusa]